MIGAVELSSGAVVAGHEQQAAARSHRRGARPARVGAGNIGDPPPSLAGSVGIGIGQICPIGFFRTARPHFDPAEEVKDSSADSDLRFDPPGPRDRFQQPPGRAGVAQVQRPETSHRRDRVRTIDAAGDIKSVAGDGPGGKRARAGEGRERPPVQRPPVPGQRKDIVVMLAPAASAGADQFALIGCAHSIG